MRKLLTAAFVLALLFLQTSSVAQQKFIFGKISPEDFNIKSPLLDSSTSAIVIADVGNSKFMKNTISRAFYLLFKERKRIKIISKNGFDAATISIPLFVSSNDNGEELHALEAYTYNLENGKVVETKVAKGSIFTEQRSKNVLVKKFTFPSVKEGSIIEFSYEVQSPYFTNLQPWPFQGEYPVLWSQYETSIPEFFKYVTLSQGYQPFFINEVKNSNGLNSFNIDGRIEYHNWVMKNVPALKEEAYTTTIRNSISKVEFQLAQLPFPMCSYNFQEVDWEMLSVRIEIQL